MIDYDVIVGNPSITCISFTQNHQYFMAESIQISSELKSLIEKYLKETNDKRDLIQFVTDYLTLGLNDLIHKTKATQKESYICRDPNPKIIRRVFDMSNVIEFFVCEECSKNARYSNPTFEEAIRWDS